MDTALIFKGYIFRCAGNNKSRSHRDNVQHLLDAGAFVPSGVCVSVTPWTAAHQAPLSVRFPRQEHWSRLPCPPLGDLPDPGIKPVSLASSSLAGRFCTTAPLEETP